MRQDLANISHLDYQLASNISAALAAQDVKRSREFMNNEIERLAGHEQHPEPLKNKQEQH